MSRLLDITVPETKPATEWVRGRALQKMSPRTAHAYAQTKFVVALDAWSERSGLAGEWFEHPALPGFRLLVDSLFRPKR